MRKITVKKILFILFMAPAFCSKLFAQENDNPQKFNGKKHKQTTNMNSNDSYSNEYFTFLHVSPKSLSEQRLDAASFPVESELFCGLTKCVLGLSHNIVVGADLFGMFSAPLKPYFDSSNNNGHFYVLDAFAGVQILRDPNLNSNLNATIGLRQLYYSNSPSSLSTQGVTVSANYSQQINPVYTQGVTFNGYFTFNDAGGKNTGALSPSHPDHRQYKDTTAYFYKASQNYPTVWVSLPADVELANWGPKQTKLIMPIRVYAHFEPFYIQNYLDISENNLSISHREQNFGARFAAIGSFESVATETYGRYSFKPALGLDVATHSVKDTTSGAAEISAPHRRIIEPYVEISGSYLF